LSLQLLFNNSLSWHANFADYENFNKNPQGKKIYKLFFYHSLAKGLSFEIFSRIFPNFLIFSLQLTKNYKNLLLKSYRYGNNSREKTLKLQG
jgi:hypothetical protein